MVRIVTYTFRIEGPAFHTYRNGGNDHDAFKTFDVANKQVIDNIGGTLTEAEELISNALPEGFYCKIEE